MLVTAMFVCPAAFGQRAATSQRLADERVPAVVDRERVEAREAQNFVSCSTERRCGTMENVTAS